MHDEEKTYSVYAIASLSRNYIYVGMTNNVENRLRQHNGGQTRSTKPYRPYRLIYKEFIGLRVDARAREKYLKSGIGKEFLKTLL